MQERKQEVVSIGRIEFYTQEPRARVFLSTGDELLGVDRCHVRQDSNRTSVDMSFTLWSDPVFDRDEPDF